MMLCQVVAHLLSMQHHLFMKDIFSPFQSVTFMVWVMVKTNVSNVVFVCTKNTPPVCKSPKTATFVLVFFKQASINPPACSFFVYHRFLSEIYRNIHVFLLLPLAMSDVSDTTPNHSAHGWNVNNINPF